ncbi:MAG: glycosyltransferase family 2 protein [Marmoricola sp.]|nr:glycosyltransferase family 2 protein [Marmoricola sp.]
MSHLAVVVVNYASHDLLATHLVPVARVLPGATVVVVDNFSSADEQRHVRDLCAEHGWTPVLLEQNLGFGTGVNRAVAALDAGPTHLLLLNPDATIDADSVSLMVDHVEAHPLDLVAPTVLRPDGAVWATGTDLDLETGSMLSWHRRTGTPDPARVQPWLSGACLLMRRDLWDRIGGFDDDYFLYWEDVDLSRRVLEAGGSVAVVPGATAVHDEGGTHRGPDGGGRAKSPTYYYFNSRNRLLFAAKHLSGSRRRRWSLTAPRASYQILLRGGRRQFAHPRSSLVPAMRGTLDGWRAMRRHRP